MQKQCKKLSEGDKFEKLTVISFSHRKKSRDYYLCKCECGKEKIILGRSLVVGYTKSCGCLFFEARKKLRQSPFHHVFRWILRNYKSKSKKRGLEYRLTDKELFNLVRQNCYYCDKDPSNSMQSWKDDKRIFYNGIDRINNDFGYVTNNCVPCCYRCNVAKRNLSKEDFEKWVLTVYNRLLNKPELRDKFI